MKLKGYIIPFKENSFTIPIYGDGMSYYFHSVNEYFEIIEFYKAEFNGACFKKIYLSKQFNIGTIGAIVFCGIDYISFEQAHKNIDEIINYLNDTTTNSTYINIKKEALQISNIFHKKSHKEISNTDISLNDIIEEPVNSTFTFQLPLFRYDLEEPKDENVVSLPENNLSSTKESVITKYLEKLVLDKNLFSSNKETFFFLLRNYLEEDQRAIEEIILDSNISKGFSNYLINKSELSIMPSELHIEEILRLRAEERRKKLKEFNYRFHYNADRIKELTDIPAYKRLGIELNEIPPSNKKSAQVIISIGTQDLPHTPNENSLDKILTKG